MRTPDSLNARRVDFGPCAGCGRPLRIEGWGGGQHPSPGMLHMALCLHCDVPNVVEAGVARPPTSAETEALRQYLEEHPEVVALHQHLKAQLNESTEPRSDG